MRKSALGDLAAVLAVARRRSFRGAATELDVSTSALSHAVAAFEASLGVRLFNRTTRSVSLSEAGARFVESIAPAVAVIRGDLTMMVQDSQQDASEREITIPGSQPRKPK